MGWIYLILGTAILCGAAVLVATTRCTVPVRHARRRSRSRTGTTLQTIGRHSAGQRSIGWQPGGNELASMARHMHALRRPALSTRQDNDPFEVLALQCRLTALAGEIQRLERDSTTIALAHHLRATQYAYDALLAEACRLVGLQGEAEAPPVPDDTTGSWIVDEETRMRKELELCSRGWTW